MPALFDKYFLNLPQFDRLGDFDSFWDKSIDELKTIPLEGHTKPSKKHIKDFDCFDISFKSIFKATIEGRLCIPSGSTDSFPIIIFHDYNSKDFYNNFKIDTAFSYLFITLRNHQHIEKHDPAEKPQTKGEILTPNFLAENIHDKSRYYLKGLYLDALRSIDFLRLNRKINCSSIAVIGRGLGSACALFAAAYSKRIKIISIDAPALCYLSFSQNHSKSDISTEINRGIASQKDKTAVKKNLTYFDSLNFADKISVPIQMIVGLKDTQNPAQAAFALFNHIIAEKTAEVYPDSGYETGSGKQWDKAIKFIKENLDSN
ncbi:MAG TPA: acetylxylan esterase [Spirochaetota bacterium]|nr:acetylxylan esterase [Spirochaetota bacterium]